MKPLDPRLLRYARSARWYLALTVALGMLTAAAVVAQALFLARALGPAVIEGADLSSRLGWIAALAGAFAARVVIVSVQERFAHRAATRAINELRASVVEHVCAGTTRPSDVEQGPRTVTLVTRGLDALEPYFIRYLPQLVLAATVTPATLLVVLGLDWIAAVTIAVTIPLVPVFMILIGRLTEGVSARGLAAMARLGSQTLDLLAGLPTLRAFGRERGPAARVQALGDAHRRATMGTLRIAFLSGMVLELLTTLSVALVAVGIGFRLLYGQVDLTTAIAVLVLAPEVYLPLRQVGAQFHASTDGVAAAEAAFAVLDEPLPRVGTTPAPDLRSTTIRLRGVTVVAAGRGRLAPHQLDLDVTPGSVTALAGENGSGKSTAVEVVLGLLQPDAGTVELVTADGATIPVADLDLTSLHRQVSWLPQRPVIEPGTLASVVDPHGVATPAQREAAAALTGADAVVAEAALGWDSPVGRGGVGLSVGQRQRLALTRALLADAPVVILDEPTAHLDAAAEATVLATITAMRDAGRTVLLVAHRPALLAVATTVVTVAAAVDPGPGSPAVGEIGAGEVGAGEVGAGDPGASRHGTTSPTPDPQPVPSEEATS